MAQIDGQLSESKKTKRRLHPSLRIDMTPMVDLGFLLITFFIFTTTMSEKKAMKLYMPVTRGVFTPTPESKVLTILLARDNKVYAYEGKFEDAVEANRIIPTNFSESNGIGNLIRLKQKKLQEANKNAGSDALVFLIKPTKQASYKNVVDALDETTINAVKKFMILDISPEEALYLTHLTQ